MKLLFHFGSAGSGSRAMIRSKVTIASSNRSRSTSTSARTVNASGSSAHSASARSQLASASSERPSLAQDDGACDEGGTMAGLDRKRTIHRRQRFGRPAELVERVGAVVVGVGKGRRKRDRPLQARERRS